MASSSPSDGTVTLTFTRDELRALSGALSEDRVKRKLRLSLLEVVRGAAAAAGEDASLCAGKQTAKKTTRAQKASGSDDVGGTGEVGEADACLAPAPPPSSSAAEAAALPLPRPPAAVPDPSSAAAAIVIVGCGEVSRLYAHCIARKPGFVITGVCDIDRTRATALAAEIDGIQSRIYDVYEGAYDAAHDEAYDGDCNGDGDGDGDTNASSAKASACKAKRSNGHIVGSGGSGIIGSGGGRGGWPASSSPPSSSSTPSSSIAVHPVAVAQSTTELFAMLPPSRCRVAVNLTPTDFHFITNRACLQVRTRERETERERETKLPVVRVACCVLCVVVGRIIFYKYEKIERDIALLMCVCLQVNRE